jgi:alkaline phosphatase D
MGQVTVSGLQPAQRYFYCVLLDGRPAMLAPYPSFITAPPEGTPGRVRFAFISCVGYHHYDAAAGWADMVRTNFDLVLLLGDNHYGNSPLPAKQRAAYYDQRRTAGYREVTGRVPAYAVWDDHDYGPDNSDGTLKGKDLALQSFKEHWANPAYGEPDNPGVYFKFTRGDVDFFLLDVRYYRSPNKSTNLATKTMLGAAQLAWLKRELAASRAPIKVLASGSEFQSYGTEDSWRSFQRERDELFGFIEEHRIPGVLLVSGDRHFTAAYQVKGRWLEVTSGPLGSSFADSKPTPEMFYHAGRGRFYCIYDLDTRGQPPAVTLEVYRVGDGLIHRRAFTWGEVTGETKIPPLTTPTRTEGARPTTAQPKP